MSRQPVRVLVVDDSAFMRKSIREMLERTPMIEVVGIARNGQDGLEQTAELKPDVVTVDLFMPEMDGVSYVQAQMARQPLPIVICSSEAEGGERVLAAMDAGAVEFVQKPTGRALDKIYNIGEHLVRAVLAAAAVPSDKLLNLSPPAIEAPVKPPSIPSPVARPETRVDAIFIGISTGGPRALRIILPQIPIDFPAAIAIVLHMPVGYTRLMAERLNDSSQIEVVESAEGVEMKPGRAILAQAGFNMRFHRQAAGQVVTRLSPPRAMEGLYTPSVDVMFQSGAEVYGKRSMGVILTGMGNDGTSGSAWIKSQGGVVIAEAESSSVVFGMPRSVIEAGLADRVVPLHQLVETIMEMLV